MKRIYVIILCLCATTMSFAQVQQRQGQQRQGQQPQGWQQRQRPFTPEDFNKKLEEFVKDEADLTKDEAQKLFPLMHEMLKKQREINGKIQFTMMKGFTAKTEADFEKIVTWSTDLEVQSKKLEQQYYKKFHSVLSWKKVCKVRVALSKWNVEVLKYFTPQQNNGMPGWQQGYPGQRQNNNNRQMQGQRFGQQQNQNK